MHSLRDRPSGLISPSAQRFSIQLVANLFEPPLPGRRPLLRVPPCLQPPARGGGRRALPLSLTPPPPAAAVTWPRPPIPPTPRPPHRVLPPLVYLQELVDVPNNHRLAEVLYVRVGEHPRSHLGRSLPGGRPRDVVRAVEKGLVPPEDFAGLAVRLARRVGAALDARLLGTVWRGNEFVAASAFVTFQRSAPRRETRSTERQTLDAGRRRLGETPTERGGALTPSCEALSAQFALRVIRLGRRSLVATVAPHAQDLRRRVARVVVAVIVALLLGWYRLAILILVSLHIHI